MLSHHLVGDHPMASLATAVVGMVVGVRHLVRPVVKGGVFGVEEYTHHAPDDIYAELGFRPPAGPGVHHIHERGTATQRSRAPRYEVA